MNLRDQLTSVQNQMAEEKSKTVDKNQELVAQLEAKEAELLQAIMVEDQQQASQLRIQDATEQAAYFLDNLVIEGLTMRELCVDEPQYQMLRIAVQNKIINLAEVNSRQISELQAEETAQQNALKKRIDEFQAKADQESREALEDHETIKQLRIDLKQAQSEVADYQGKLKNATDEIDRLNSHVDDLRKEIAVGARNAYKVIDSEEQDKQMKDLANQIKASRIKITGKKFTDYTNVKCEAILMQDLPSEGKVFGDRIEFPSVYAGKYMEVTAAEAEQFRAEHASHQETVSDSPLGHEETPNVTPPTAPEATFPELPRAEAPKADIPAEVQLAIPAPSDSGESGVTKTELEDRLVKFAQEHGLVKQAVA